MSRWLVGSSSSTSSGSPTSARASATRLLQPPESFATAWSAPASGPARPSFAMSSSTRASSSQEPTALAVSDKPEEMAARTVAPGANVGICGRKATRRPPRLATLPRSGPSSPARMRSNVDLPAPLGPMSPTRFPSASVKLTSSKSARAPNACPSPCAERRIATRAV